MSCSQPNRKNCVGCAQSAISEARQIFSRYNLEPGLNPDAGLIPNRQLDNDIDRMLRLLG
jgi:hypothetical protein